MRGPRNGNRTPRERFKLATARDTIRTNLTPEWVCHFWSGDVAPTESRLGLLPVAIPVKLELPELQEKARIIRQHIVRMTTAAGSGHPSSSMSATEVVTALYFGGFLRVNPKEPDWPDRDRFVLSKGHACPVLYAAMAEIGYFPPDELLTLRQLGSVLEGHPNYRRLPGIEASTGSLGQGLSIGLGQALAARLDKRPTRVYVLMGDGELGEGQVWEAAINHGREQVQGQ